MATHSSVLAWRIPGTGEPGGLPSMGSHRVRHDWSDLAAADGFADFLCPSDLFFLANCWPSNLEGQRWVFEIQFMNKQRVCSWVDKETLPVTSSFLHPAQHMIYPGEGSMCTWKECVIYCFWMECSVNIKSSPSGLMCHLRAVFPYWFLCLNELSIDISVVLNSPCVIVSLSISPFFMPVNICVLYWGAPILGCIYIYNLLYFFLGLILWSLCSVLCLL